METQNNNERFARTDDEAVERLFDEICQLRMTQLRALNEALCSRLSLRVIGSFAQTVDTAAQRVEEPEKLIPAVKAPGANKIEAIKAVRTLMGLGLKEAKDFVEGLPRSLQARDNQAEAQAEADRWIQAGFDVELT